ncbi:MAG: type III-A CRISPR-associated RAMP protein Csm5 [Desulfosoma sp.]
MTTYCFTAQALTPIHVGSAVEIDPLQFVLDRGFLLRFRPAQVIGELDDSERRRFLSLVDRGDLKGIQLFFRTHLKAEDRILRVGVSKRFEEEFSLKAGSPDRSFRVDMMPRNPVSEKAFLPGSSIKGAIRTAVVNYFANLDPQTKPRVHSEVKQAAVEKKAKVLEESALNRPSDQTEKDVFRLIKVRDVELPDEATRIDRAMNWNPNKPGSENIQMWVERLVSFADTWKPPAFEVEIQIDEEKMNRPEIARLLGRKLDAKTLFDACNRFYWGRMLAEADKFYGRGKNDKHWKAIHERFPRAKLPDGQVMILDPSTPYWFSEQQPRKRVLLRVGRFSHFESLSVDGLRQGYNVQARRPIRDMGSTRTLCAMDNGNLAMPFGWLILTTGDCL